METYYCEDCDEIFQEVQDDDCCPHCGFELTIYDDSDLYAFEDEYSDDCED